MLGPTTAEVKMKTQDPKDPNYYKGSGSESGSGGTEVERPISQESVGQG